MLSYALYGSKNQYLLNLNSNRMFFSRPASAPFPAIGFPTKNCAITATKPYMPFNEHRAFISHMLLYALHGSKNTYFVSRNSTHLFFARPASAPFPAIGFPTKNCALQPQSLICPSMSTAPSYLICSHMPYMVQKTTTYST